MKVPLISICCTTFNHEKYVRKTIEGFLLQKTTFPIEIIIHDDASTDGTKQIIEEYAKSDSRFVTIFQTENKYSKKIKPWPNFVFPKARGKYLALCEGDDYWIDPLKLQKQVDFLEANLDYGICFHEVKILEDNILKVDYITPKVSEVTTIESLSTGNFLHTPSVILRNNFKIPDWYNKVPLGDWSLYMISIKDKKIKKLNDVMAVYRIHNLGVWSSKSQIQRIEGTIKTLDLLVASGLFKSNVLSKLSSYKDNLKKDMYRIEKKERSFWESIKLLFK